MKKKILSVIVLILGTVSATFATDLKPIPDAIVNELHQEFKSASNVAWKTTASFYKASFTVNSLPLEAFFSYDGQLIGVSRKLLINQLPLSLIKATMQRGVARDVTDLFELSTDRGTEYFITYGTGKDQKIFKSSGTSWNRFDANDFK